MNDDRRVARLEEEITITRAQAERDAIEHQHTSKALEDKFLVLLNDYNALKAAEQQLQARNNDLQKETKTLRSSVQDLQSKPNEIQSLHNEKRALDNCLEARDIKIAELEERLQKSQASITALRTENMEMDGTVLELKASKHQAEEETAEAKQQNSNLKRSIQWLEEQARDLGHTIDTVQQRGSKQANELLAKLQAAEEARSGLEKLEVSLRAQLETSKETSKAQIDELVADNEKLVKDNSELEKQLSSAQKLIALYKKNSEQRTTEVLDLQNVIRDLRSHIEEMTGAHKTAISQLEEAVNEAEKRLEEEKARAKLVLSAATSGQFLTGPEGAPETSTAEDPGLQAEPPLAAKMSKTELFTKLTEATAEWRRLSLQNQQNEIILDGVVAEMEKRGAAMREQEADYVRVQQSYSAMVASLEVARNERRFAESKVLDLEFEIRSREKTIRILQQQVKDNGRQIVVLLNEQQRLTGGQMAGGSRPQTPQPRAFGSPASAHDSPYGSASQAIVPVSNGTGRLAANDALSKHITFANIQELQEKNERQLLLIRDMSEQLEEASSELKKEMEAEKQAMRQKMEGELEHVKKQRQEQTAIVTQIAGQRDLYRKLLQDVANKPQGAAASAADLQLLEGFRNPTQSSSIKAQDAEKYERLYNETKRELNQKLDDSAENLRIMRNDYSRANDEATQARSEVARAKAEVAFERQNVERLNGFLEEHRIQLKIEADFSAKNQETIAALQERWSAESGKVQSVQFQLKAAENKVSSLEHESAALERQVERLKADLHQETTARISLEAELRALRKEHLDLEAEQVQQIHDLKVRLAAAESAKSTADDELQNAEKLAQRVTEMHSTSKADLEARVRAAEDLARASKSAETEAVRLLNVQKEQVVSLQKLLQEAQLHTAPAQEAKSGPQSSKVAASDEGTEQRQARAIQLLQGELKSALERAEQASQDAAQYRAVAEGSDLALQALQAQASSDKKTFEQQAATSAAEVERLTRELDASITACSEIEEKLKSSNIASTQSAVRASNETSKLQEHLKELDRLILAKTEDLAEKERDVNFWRQKYNTAESRSHAEVVGHAETVKLLQAAESSRQVLNDSVAAHLKAEKEARDKQAEAELRLSQIEAQLKEKVDQTEKKLAEIEEQNKQLHDSLQEKLRSGDTGGETEKELAGVISHLRHRAEVLEVEKQLASSEAEQYRSEIGVLRKTLDSLKTQLASESTRQQQAQNEEALFEERRKHQADLQMIKESNVSLRSQNASIQSQNASLKGEVQLLQSQLKPQELTILQLRADVEAAEEEVASKAIEAANWERRANHLRQKYGTVDLEEHKKVQAKLAELSENTVPRVDLQKAQARVRELEAKASAQVGKEYHDNFTKQLNSQIATLKKNLQQEQSRNAIHLSEITGLKEKITELEGDKKALDSKVFRATRMMNKFNPKKLAPDDFKAEREAELKESEAARELAAALQEFITGELSPAAVTEQLRANRESLATLQSQLRGSTQASQEMASLQQALQNSRKYAGGLQEDLQSSKLALSQAESKLAAAEALVSELQHRVRGLETSLNSTQSRKTAAPRAGHQASPLPAPELVSGPSSSGPVPTNEAMNSSAPSVQLDVMQTEAPQPESGPEELASEVQPTHQPPQLTHPAASLPEEALENLPPPEVMEPLLQSEPLARQLAEADSSAVRASDAAAFIPLEPVESQEPTDLDIPSNPKADASQAGPESSEAKPVLIEPTTSPLEQSVPTHVTQPTEPDPMTEPEPIINPEGAAPAEAPKDPEDSAPAPEQSGQAPASSAPALAEQEQAALPAAPTEPAQAHQPAESLPTPGPITPQLKPNAPPFPGGDIMELLRQQALAQAQQPKSNQSTPPPLAPISHTPPPISQPAPPQQHLEGPGTARRLAGEAAVKRQQETSQSSEPPAKRARSHATAVASIGPAIAASTTPVTSSSLIERTVTDASQAEDVADDAQSSGSEEVKELQDDPMERETRNQEQQEPVELTDSDGAETEDEAGDEIGQDMPSLPSSPHRPAAAEDPTQPPASPKASAEYPTHPPAATVASHDLAQEKEDEPKEEKAAEQGGPRKRRVQPIVWSGASGREKEDQKSKKEGSPPPGGRGGSLIRQVRRGRGRGRST